MKIDKKLLKHYSFVALVLGGIASISALLIALTYMITNSVIEENNLKKTLESLKNIYGEDKIYEKVEDIDNQSYSYLNSYYASYNSLENNQKGDLIGYVFSCDGKNDYGTIEMIVGINVDSDISKIYLIVNNQSFGQTVQNNYVDSFNNGEIEIGDVSCGATYSATLIRDMSLQAQQYFNDFLGK